jgi:hypothetical protein
MRAPSSLTRQAADTILHIFRIEYSAWLRGEGDVSSLRDQIAAVVADAVNAAVQTALADTHTDD